MLVDELVKNGVLQNANGGGYFILLLFVILLVKLKFG